MRLRNLFMILLLCMTVGVLGTSCTGDDGATGPQGPQGPKGDPGEPGEPVDPSDSESTAFYSFLKSWGSETGEIACSDPLLQGMGSLPGEGMMKPLSAEQRADAALNSAVAVAIADPQAAGECSDAFFSTGLNFAKTMRMEATTEPEVDVPASEFNQPHKLEVTKELVGGTVTAKLDTRGGSDEPIERGYLYNNCGEGTTPANIKGDWSAAKIAEKRTVYTDGKPSVVATTTTTKVCVRLDSHPGAVKCYVRVVAPDSPLDTDTDEEISEQIALYDGEMLTTVVSQEKLGTGAGTPVAATFVSADDVPQVQRLCGLFAEGLASE